jgi:hypothetical protein
VATEAQIAKAVAALGDEAFLPSSKINIPEHWVSARTLAELVLATVEPAPPKAAVAKKQTRGR